MAVETIIAAGVMAVSAMGAASTYEQGQYANTAARRQAQMYQQQSRYVQQQAGLKMSADDYNAIQLISRIKTGAAASGIATSTGAPGILTSVSAQQARINDIFTQYSANIKSANLAESAALEESQGEQEMKAADVGAVTGLISGGIKAYGIESGYGTRGGGTYGAGTIP